MKKKYEITFNEFDDLVKYLKQEFEMEFKPQIRVKTVVVMLTDKELTTVRGAYNATAQALPND